MLECVEAAVKKVIEMGYVDPKRIGVNGHSYGGEGAAFIGTRSKMFAAVGMGAGVTDLYSRLQPELGLVVSGHRRQRRQRQRLLPVTARAAGASRRGTTPRSTASSRRSRTCAKPSAPFLIMHGTADPTVSFSEGMNFYNALRYNNKNAVMLAYPGEGHGLRGMANRKDLTVRFFEFFNHYLKGAPAPKWLTEGVPFSKRARAASRDEVQHG